jgi:zinc transport system substrate-binding protein
MYLPFFLVLFGGTVLFLSSSTHELSASCGTANTPNCTSSEKITVYVVNYPLQYFAERIGGEHVTVVFPAPPDGDPAYWRPNPQAISNYQSADLILLNGAKYAKWIDKVSLPRMRMVDTSGKFKDRYIISKELVTHSHGPEGEHAHESTAFTTWIDFDLASQQAKTIAAALSRKQPDLKATFEKNYAALEKDLLALDQEIKAVVSKNPSQPFVVSHPVYDYLSRRYGLNIKSLHWEPDEVPNNEQMAELQVMLAKHPAKWMIWEGDPLPESVEKLKSMDVSSLVFDPCGNKPDQGDFLTVMKQNIENLKKAFQ